MAKRTVISVIDDDESVCSVVASLLRSFDYEAPTFASAEAFLAWDGADACDCVIADIHMPGMSGIDLKNLLVARECEVPVILITARMDPGVESRARSSGAAGILKKPFAAEALMKCIGEALGR